VKRKQCNKCPWRVDVDPNDIPNGYCVQRHKNLKSTIAEPGRFDIQGMRMMVCHETPPGKEKVCVGWLANQMGPGNNIGLRLAAMKGLVDCNVELVGDQHDRFEDTLPRKKRTPAGGAR